jgi:hypothetical protein
MVKLNLQILHTYSWRDVKLFKSWDNFMFTDFPKIQGKNWTDRQA